MCGIAGIYKPQGGKVEMSQLKAMTDIIQHRGPDGEGQWINDIGNVGLGHRRLSILDLSLDGRQPMHYMGRYHLTFNGEIYNYLEVKSELEKKNYKFHSKTDSEVILAAYDAYGVNCLNYFDGMFALVIWDDKEEQLFCARDRFGEKPFFYTRKGDDFMFASEMKSFFNIGVEKTVNHEMLYYYLCHNVVENSRNKSETFFKNVFRLERGHFLIVGKDSFEKKSYWNLDNIETNITITMSDAVDRFKELFNTSIDRRMRSDVKVGSSLSGGLDSSSIVRTITNNYDDLKDFSTYSARFHDKDLDEGRFIDIVTNHKAINPINIWPDENTLYDELEKVFYHQEEPFQSSSIFAQWEVMKSANQNGTTVLLDGQGADEVLAGYSYYYPIFLRELYFSDKKLMNSEIQALQQIHSLQFQVSKASLIESLYPKFFSAARSFKRHFHFRPAEDLSGSYKKSYHRSDSPFNEVSRSLSKSLKYSTLGYGLEKLLRYSDRNSMAHSREVRLPYLSHELVEFVFSLPSSFKIHNGWTKYILRQSMENVLPEEIVWRKDKKGFGPPEASWLSNEKLIGLVQESKDILKMEGILSAPDPKKSWQYIMAYYLIKGDKA